MRLFHMFSPKTSGSIAKERISLLLISDRADCSPEMMEMMKKDIVHVISKYMAIDFENVELQIAQSDVKDGKKAGRVLLANIPIKDLRHVS
ncbi:MAG: cell division topological specificity factor MinE [Lachnospiraceae bacterium]|nr:cell division topological specificity factor MinE [Lachnospiraceae bacterium]